MLLIFLLISGFIFEGYTSLTPEINTIELTISGSKEGAGALRIALLSDLHVVDDSDGLLELATLWSDVLAAEPDIIMLAGDYVNNGGSPQDVTEHRIAISQVLGSAGKIPVVAVLGNHDEWSDPVLWAQELRAAGALVLENQVITLNDLNLCVRGFGDAFTGQFRYLEFPKDCDEKLQVSLTHDPAGAFDPRVKGLVLAGHTHCGQIRLPFVGALYVPSSAPKRSHCGLYTDRQRQVFVSSGVGTSVLPIRFLAQAQWDLITLR